MSTRAYRGLDAATGGKSSRPLTAARAARLRAALLAVAAVAMVAVVASGCARGAPSRPGERTDDAGAARSTTQLIEAAETHERDRRYDRARALYEQARDEAPDAQSRVHALRALARALVFWGEYADAEAQLSALVALRPTDAPSWHDLGILRHRRGEMAGAEAAFRRAITARPRDARPRIALAALLWKQDRLDDALREYVALRDVPVPGRVREKVEWAIRTLRARIEGARPAP